MLQGKARQPKKKKEKKWKKKSITTKPLGIKPYASSMKVAPAVSNKKIPRKIVFHCREPPWMLFKDKMR
jgi:hypothetical protein